MFMLKARYTIRVKRSLQTYTYNYECDGKTYAECLRNLNAIIKKVCKEQDGYLFTVDISVVNRGGYVDI